MSCQIKKVDVPEGESGDWKVEHFIVREDEAKLHNLREAINGSRRTIRPGTYTQLLRRGRIIMSDTKAELDDIWTVVWKAKSSEVLINGLGLGVVLQAILEKPEIEHLTVIEKSGDVINLVGQHWKDRYGDRLTIICADAFEWKPPKNRRYSVVWHDIWDNITADNLPEMHRLHRKYGRRCDWQGSWCRWQCEEARRRYGK